MLARSFLQNKELVVKKRFNVVCRDVPCRRARNQKP
ncbi:hypothetical protein U879_00255 [Defluviimonas sp. 20V17]|nr:hypothetical protein U879_00255 [Defluviimonas sp. 20V17]